MIAQDTRLEQETHQRCSKRIDFIPCTQRMLLYIHSCGITTYTIVVPLDHRDLFIDVDI